MKYVGDRIVYLSKHSHDAHYSLDLPIYHRAAVGLFPGTRVFIIPVPRSQELLVSTIRPDNWGDLWKLEVGLKDIPGAVRSITETLVKNNVNILVQEGLSDCPDDRVKAHQLSLILDLNRYDDKIDGSTDTRNHVNRPNLRPNALINEIVHNSTDFMLLDSGGHRWAFRFERMKSFYNYKAYRSESAESPIIGHDLIIPQKIVEDIFQGKVPGRIACHVISDTEEKYLKINFLPPRDRYLLLGIEHKEEVGAIFQFTEIIAKRGINIVNSYSRLHAMDKRAVWNCFLAVPGDLNANDLASLCEDLEKEASITGFFVRDHYGFPFDLENTIKKKGKFRGYIHHKDLTLTPMLMPPGDSTHKTKAYEDQLGLEPFYLNKKLTRKPNHVFVAMPFDDLYEDFYNDHIKETLEKSGLFPIRIDKITFSNPNSNILERIHEEIVACEFMVADVSKNNANVLYEVGLAHAIGRKVLIIREEIERSSGQALLFDIAQKRHLFYSPYRLKQFDQKFEEAIQAIRGVPAAS